MSDEQILELAAMKQPDRERYYLLQELDARGIRDKVREKKLQRLKEGKQTRGLFVTAGLIIFSLFMISRLGSRLTSGW